MKRTKSFFSALFQIIVTRRKSFLGRAVAFIFFIVLTPLALVLSLFFFRSSKGKRDGEEPWSEYIYPMF